MNCWHGATKREELVIRGGVYHYGYYYAGFHGHNPLPIAPPWHYRLLVMVLAPLLVLYSIWQGYQNSNSSLTRQRLGLNMPHRRDHPVWLHMASVGEVNAATPLIHELQQRHPQLPIIVSTITATGAAMAQKNFPGIEHCYLPLDFAYATRRLIKGMQPRCAIIIETEIWPQLYYQCRQQKIPLLIVNGRLSPRTLHRPAWIYAVYQRALANVTQILARSTPDAERFLRLGAHATQISVVGNIKFAAMHPQHAIKPITLSRPYIVAASTHADEELRLSRAWLTSSLHHAYLLVIVPRHPQRKDAILKQLQPYNIVLAVRSRNDPVTNATQIYLADTFGELPQFIAGAALVCMGGSFVAHGGQNLLEVARLGKVALFGPYMENFTEERDLLLAQQAAVGVKDMAELITNMEELLRLAPLLYTMGERARLVVESKANIIQHYAQALEYYLTAS